MVSVFCENEKVENNKNEIPINKKYFFINKMRAMI